MPLDDCRTIDLPRVHDPRGNLTFVEGSKHVPFEIKRVFYLYDVPGGESRAGHALDSCHQFLIAMSGSFDARLDDGDRVETVCLNRSYFGLYIPPRIWRVLDNFSSGAVCMVLASEPYSAQGYFRDHEQFVRMMRSQSP
jgi:hypothetical protein